jgi:hypothetical protein
MWKPEKRWKTEKHLALTIPPSVLPTEQLIQ